MFDKIKKAIEKKNEKKNQESIKRGRKETANILVCGNKKGIEKNPGASIGEYAAAAYDGLNKIIAAKHEAENKVKDLQNQLNKERKEHEEAMKKQEEYYKTEITNLRSQKRYLASLKRQKTELDDKVDEYIKWYFKNSVKGQYTEVGEYLCPREMRNAIETIAVWYELRYPEDEVNRLINVEGIYNDINSNLIESNKHVEEVIRPVCLDDKSENTGFIRRWNRSFLKRNNKVLYDTMIAEGVIQKETEIPTTVSKFDWTKFLDLNTLMSLMDERWVLSKLDTSGYVYLDRKCCACQPFLYISVDGIVKDAQYVTQITNYQVNNDELIGLTPGQVANLFAERGVVLPKENDFDSLIDRIKKWNQQQEGMLDCVMYRLIERGGNRIGPRRAFLFAKEFGRDINVPMQYAADTTDPYLRNFINEYLKAGGSENLVCYTNYFMRESANAKLESLTIRELLKLHNKPTQEELDTIRRIAKILASTPQYKEGEQAKILQKS